MKDHQVNVAKAMSAISRFDIYKKPLLVQLQYGEKAEQLLLISTMDEQGDVQSSKVAINWKVEVRFENNNTITTVGPIIVPAGAELTSKEPNIGKATEGAVRQLESQGLLKLPVIIRVTTGRQGYAIIFRRLPQTPGGSTIVKVSKDLKRYTVVPGE